MVYKAKPKTESEEQKQEASPSQAPESSRVVTDVSEQTSEQKSKKDKPKRERKPKAAAADKAAGAQTEEKKTEQSSASVSEKKQESEHQPVKAEKPKKERAPKTEKAQSAHGPTTSSSDVQLQQLLIQKEKEIGNLHIMFDKQEAKIAAQAKENDQLKEQLKLNSDENTLKQAIQALNEQLTKQQNLNRLQAGQILDFEQKLWQANKQRDEAENSLSEYQNGASAPLPDADNSASNAQELRVKQVQLREAQDKIDMYLGKATAINGLNKSQLTSLNDDLQHSLFTVGVAMKNNASKK